MSMQIYVSPGLYEDEPQPLDETNLCKIHLNYFDGTFNAWSKLRKQIKTADISK